MLLDEGTVLPEPVGILLLIKLMYKILNCLKKLSQKLQSFERHIFICLKYMYLLTTRGQRSRVSVDVSYSNIKHIIFFYA